MNWTPEVVRAEMDYRIERAVGDVRDSEQLAQLRAARERHQSWWRRLREQHRDENGERSAA
jgi:hypothetical protein